MSHHNLIVASIVQLVTNNKNQMRTADFAYFRQKRKINHVNFVSKAYSPPLDRYCSLALNYDSKSKG